MTEGALVLAGTGGDAIRHETLDDEGVSGESTLLVDNSGVIDGSIRLHADGDPVAGLIQNNTGGTLRGATVYTGTLTNSGTVAIGDRGNKGTTRLSGDFTQSESGILQVGVDFSGARSDLFSIEGNATFSGQLSVDAGTLAPNVELEVVNVVGALNGSLEAADTAAVDYSLRTEGGSVKVSVADTRFESAFSVFNRNQRNMGLTWMRSSTPGVVLMEGCSQIWIACRKAIPAVSLLQKLCPLLHLEARRQPPQHRLNWPRVVSVKF